MSKALFNLPVLMAAVTSLAATAVITALVFAGPPLTPQPPTLMLDEPMPAPPFSVTDHQGNTLTNDDLLGRVWVCDFFLSRCNGICPILGRTMADLAVELSSDEQFEGVRLVSFSVDPEHDTPDTLALYRKINAGVWDRGKDQRRAAIDRFWVHTSGKDRATFWPIVGEGGFGLYVGESVNDPKTPVAHSGKLVLIGKRGDIRGYYDGLTDADMPALFADIRRLVEETD